jgi:multidrug resistance efflux pump
MLNRLATKYVLPLVAGGLLIFAVVFVQGQGQSIEPVKPATAPPQTPFEHTVAGAGLVEAETENIAIGSPTSGVVVEVFVKVGKVVTVGDKLFRLDDRMLQAELRNRAAAVASAQADLARLENQPRPEQLRSSAAQLTEAKANLVNLEDQLNRTRELFKKKVDTAEAMMSRQQAVRMAEAQVAKAQADYDMQENGAWKYDVDIAKAALAQAEAQRELVATEIDRLNVRALVDGQVLQVNVRPGEFVGAPQGQALIILGNIQLMHVRVDIDENDIPRFVLGAPGVAMLRGQPDVEFPLKFVRVEPYVVPKKSLTGDNMERVDTRVLQVIYAIDAKNQPLYVGQQLDVFIEVGAPSKTPPPASPTAAAPTT